MVDEQKENPAMGDKQKGKNPVVCDVVLAYLAHSLENSSVSHVKTVCCQHFSSDEVVKARDTLWETVDETFLPRMIRRHSITTMKGVELTISDIIAAFNNMATAGCFPHFTVYYEDIGRLPLSKPTETCAVSMCDRLAKLEERLEATEDMVVKEQGKVAALKNQLDQMNKKSYAEASSGGLWELSKFPEQKERDAGNRYSLPRPMQSTTEKYMMSNRDTRPKQLYAASNRDTRPKQLYAASKTGDFGSCQSLGSDAPSLHADGFEYQKKEAKRRRRQVVKGKKSGEESGLRVAPEPSRDIFVYRLVKDTKEKEITEYMTKNKMAPRAVTKVSHEDSKLASFRVEVQASLLQVALDPDSWPENVCVRRFWKRSTDVETTSGDELK